MYTEEDVSTFTALSNKLLETNADTLTDTEAQQFIQELIDAINFHDYRYYIAAEPVITDFEYDKLFKLLKALEHKFPQLLTPDSPTQRVSFGLTKVFPVVEHLVPMLSLDNSYNEADLVDFDRRAKEITGKHEISYSVEPKYDGSSISLVYEDDILVRGVTRGDGIMGEDVTPNVKVIRSIPLKAAFSKFGIKTIEIRGEVVIRKDLFEKYNQAREEAGLERLANPRNSAAGSLRMQDQAEVARRNLDAVLYHISYAVDAEGHDLLGTRLKSRRENIQLLHNLGFKAPLKEQRVFEHIKGVLGYLDEWEEKRDNYEYEIDGMVIKVDDISLEDKLGATSHHPRWAIAYKFKPRQAHSKLLNVVFQVGRVGNITPVAKLNPVPIGGVVVSSVSMFNEDFIQTNDIRIGDEVLVERAGDVIPYISGVMKELRDGSEKPVIFPTHCPSCGSKLLREEEEAAWRCVNFACPEQIYWRLVHYVSKDAMDISGLGKAIIEKFIREGWLKTVTDIYNLPFDEIGKLEGFGAKSIEKLQNSIEESKNKSLNRLIFGLGIRYVGEATAKTLARAVKCIDELEHWDEEKLKGLQDVGDKVAESIHDFFRNSDNRKLIAELARLGVKTCNEDRDANSNDLSGVTFLFTGSLEKFTRPEAKEMVEAAGGIVANSLSSKVNYLVVGADPGSKVEKAKKLPNVRVISEQEFLDMVNTVA
jgi:DNA ligase (NAD+)